MSQTIVFICKKNWVIYRVCFDFDASQREWKLIFMRLFHPLGELSVTIGLHLQRSKFRGLFTLLIALSPCKMLCHVQSIGITHLWLKRFVNGYSYFTKSEFIISYSVLKGFLFLSCFAAFRSELDYRWTAEDEVSIVWTCCNLSVQTYMKMWWTCGTLSFLNLFST